MEGSVAKPTIKGIFVRSHIKALRDKMGEDAINELEARFGKPVNFKNSEDVLVSDEVKIIEICLDLSSDQPISDSDRAYEAGKLHFRNFATTPLAKIVFSVFQKQFKTVMLNADKIAGHVFQGVKFHSEDISPTSVKITMTNNDYPLDHFRGLFAEWMSFAGHSGSVDAKETKSGDYVYLMEWK